MFKLTPFIYSYVSNGYDELEYTLSKDLPRKCISKTYQTDFWKHESPEIIFPSERLTARYYKTKYANFLDQEVSIWQDGKVILKDEILDLVETLIKQNLDLILFEHPERTDIFQECDVVINMNKHLPHKPEILYNQISRYKKTINFFKLFETCVLIWRHTLASKEMKNCSIAAKNNKYFSIKNHDVNYDSYRNEIKLI